MMIIDGLVGFATDVASHPLEASVVVGVSLAFVLGYRWWLA